MRFLLFLCLFWSIFFQPGAVLAAASEWHHVEGGALRLVIDDAPDTSGNLRGALEIRLKPGWKTYWQDPGASGVPPALAAMIDGKTTGVEISFPPPRRFDDGYALWAGYDHPVALPLTLAIPEGVTAPARLEADIFLGICETICIPVQAILSLDIGAVSVTGDHAIIIEDAFAALPQPARPGFAAQLGASDPKAIMIETDLPENTKVLDLFVAGTQTLMLDTPQMHNNAGRVMYHVPVLANSTPSGSKEELSYTLITNKGAVSGQIILP